MGTTGSVLDTSLARLIALALSLVLGALFVLWAADDISRPFAARQDVPTEAPSLAETNADPAVTSCLAQRLGEVDSMLADGIINDAQHVAFASRATNYCIAQGGGR